LTAKDVGLGRLNNDDLYYGYTTPYLGLLP